MAHGISHQNGRDEIAYAGETPWHGLGVKLDGLQTVGDMLKYAGLLWPVEKRTLYIGGPDPVLPYTVVDGWNALIRTDTRATLGVVTDRYVPIQNTQAGDVVDALIAEGGAHVEVAGALGQGERCWMLARIPGDFEVVKGDTIKPYFLLAWGHDGKHGLAGKLTLVRVVCANTLAAAGFARGAKWSQSADVYIRHTGDAKLRIDDARKALGVMRKQVEATTEVYRAMTATPLDMPHAYFETVFPSPARSIASIPLASPDRPAFDAKLIRWQEHQDKVLALYEGGHGADLARGSVWNGYNAVTEYVDHAYPVLQSGKVSVARQWSAMFGLAAETKRAAFNAALALVSS